jgi:hypothetical protein
MKILEQFVYICDENFYGKFHMALKTKNNI